MVTVVNGAAGTIQVKLGAGRVYDVVGIAAGTAYSYTVKDGPDTAGNFVTIACASPMVVAAGQHLMTQGQYFSFKNGLAFTVAGTPGEFDVLFD